MLWRNLLFVLINLYRSNFRKAARRAAQPTLITFRPPSLENYLVILQLKIERTCLLFFYLLYSLLFLSKSILSNPTAIVKLEACGLPLFFLFVN